MTPPPTHELVMRFRDQSQSFGNGFALGQLWHRLRHERAPFTVILLSELREDIILMATHTGWREDITELVASVAEHPTLDVSLGWIKVTLTPERK